MEAERRQREDALTRLKAFLISCGFSAEAQRQIEVAPQLQGSLELCYRT